MYPNVGVSTMHFPILALTNLPIGRSKMGSFRPVDHPFGYRENGLLFIY
jgi:hypothetical protein